MEKLYSFGWNNYIDNTGIQMLEDLDNIGRVISIAGFKYYLITAEGVLEAELLGKLLTYDNHEQPKVGDWVKFIQVDTCAFINEVLPRYNAFYRKSSGKEVYRQVAATNLEQVVIIQGLDQDFNIMRLERYLVQIATCKISPAVVFSKADLIDDRRPFVEALDRLGRNIKPYFYSSITGEGLENLLEEVFMCGTTNLLVGSSGVGKSSLINALQKRNVRNTAGISQASKKGKHTTTTRDMLLLDNGGIIIDTPGMRELGVGYEEEADFGERFPLIHQYAKGCRYSDCSHINEEGCAVITAFQKGNIDIAVYESYLKLMKEQERFQWSEHQKKRRGKQFGKMVKEAKAYRKKFKY